MANMTPKEEIIFGDMHRILEKYSDIDETTKNNIVTEMLGILVNALEDIEEKYKGRIKSKASSDPVIDALVSLWNLQEWAVSRRHRVDVKYNEAVMKYGGETEREHWCRSRAYVDNEREILNANKMDARLGFLKWSITHFPNKLEAKELTDLIKETLKSYKEKTNEPGDGRKT